jgi:NAD(P)-dependent dehydrogenase (short-subunit alcohol dehydrogenase family)
VVADLDAPGAEAIAAELGGEAWAVAFDLADTGSIDRLVAGTAERFGRLDVLVNNAALRAREVASRDTTVEATDLDVWDRMLEANARGFAAACRAAIPHLRVAGGGSIVNLTSEQALAGAHSGSAYAASKAAIIALTRSVATQCGPDGIRSNAVAPGLIVSDRIRANAGALLDAVLPHLPLGRHGEPQDVADLICFLASDEASFITGQVIAVDGGYLAHMPAG